MDDQRQGDPGTEDPFAGKAEWFDDQYRSTARGRIRLQLVLDRVRAALPPPPARVVDAGGGTGAFAIPLAQEGYEVTLLDPSDEWLGVAASRAEDAGVALSLVQGPLERAPGLAGVGFDAVLCHAVLAYVDDPDHAMTGLRMSAREGAVLSSLEKNRSALPLRPGYQGDYAESRRLLDEGRAAGRLGIVNRSFYPGELRALLVRTGWLPGAWAGVRLFSDVAPEEMAEDDFAALLDLERTLARRDPLRRVGRLLHVISRAAPADPPTLGDLQTASFERAGAGTRESWPEERSLDGPALAEFLDRKRYGVLSTCRKDGRPHATMVAFCPREDRLWLPAVGAAVRLRNVEAEPWASFVVSEGEGAGHTVVVFEGDALVHNDPEPMLRAWLRAGWWERFGTELDWADAVIELRPRKVLSYGPAETASGS